MEVIDVLKKTRDLLLAEDAWTKRTYARDSEGKSVDDTDEDACSWCILGAIRYVGKDPKVRDSAIFFVDYFAKQVGHRSVTMFNDSMSTEHVDVVKFLDNAIEHCRINE